MGLYHYTATPLWDYNTTRSPPCGTISLYWARLYITIVLLLLLNKDGEWVTESVRPAPPYVAPHSRLLLLLLLLLWPPFSGALLLNVACGLQHRAVAASNTSCTGL